MEEVELSLLVEFSLQVEIEESPLFHIDVKVWDDFLGLLLALAQSSLLLAVFLQAVPVASRVKLGNSGQGLLAPCSSLVVSGSGFFAKKDESLLCLPANSVK